MGTLIGSSASKPTSKKLLDGANVALVGAVDETVTLPSDDEKRTEGLGAHVIDIADDFVGRKGVLSMSRACRRPTGARNS